MQIMNQPPVIPPPRPAGRSRTGDRAEVEPDHRERRRRQRRRGRGGGRRATDVPEASDGGAAPSPRDAPHLPSADEVMTAQLLHLRQRRLRRVTRPRPDMMATDDGA